MTSACCVFNEPPNGPTFSNFLIAPTTNNTGDTNYNPQPIVESGTTITVPSLYTQTWCNFPDQDDQSGLLKNDNWNSWNKDPIKLITGVNRTSKNGTIINGTYLVEWFYGTLPQDPLTVASGGYAIGDAQATPQNIFTVTKDNGGTGQDANEYTVQGFSSTSTSPDQSYYLRFIAYMVRFKYLAGTSDINSAQVKYGLCFFPIDPTTKFFYKMIEGPSSSLNMSDISLASADAFNEAFGQGGISKNVTETEWTASNPRTSALSIKLVSKVEYYDRIATSAVVGTPDLTGVNTFTLNPYDWPDDVTVEQPYGLTSIVSPQAQLSAYVTVASFKSYDIVFRTSVATWVTSTSATPPLSDINVQAMEPKFSPDGTGSVVTDPSVGFTDCQPLRAIAISGTVASTPGVVGIDYQPESSLYFWLLPNAKDGTILPTDVLNGLPRTLLSYADYQTNFPYSPTAPRFDLSYVVPTTDSINSVPIESLLLNGTQRITYDNGKTWSGWTSLGSRGPYLNSANYVGTPPEPKVPGGSQVLTTITPLSATCDGSGATTNLNTWIEMSITVLG